MILGGFIMIDERCVCRGIGYLGGHDNSIVLRSVIRETVTHFLNVKGM